MKFASKFYDPMFRDSSHGRLPLIENPLGYPKYGPLLSKNVLNPEINAKSQEP
jgi:hypothetical protein